MELKSEIYPDIFNFPNTHNERVEIEKFIHGLTKDIIGLKELPEWSIWFISFLWKFNNVGISKKGYTYSSHPPEKKYFIYIPVPTNKTVDWGVREKDFVPKPPLDEIKLMDKIDGIEFSDFDSLSSYIVEVSKIGIEQLLKKGISLKGIKIKI